MAGFERVSLGLFVSALVCAGVASSVHAETIAFACNSPDKAHDYRLSIDLSGSLISNDAGQGSRWWAATVTDKDVSWDEVYESRIAHVAQHYVLDRTTGTLHGTNMAGAGRETVTAACSKAP